ncbi:hypothetical protein HNY73_003371 [Argiope bruennichi]|uniref:Uncharacterized protein n=1 Tax=Argiope bruennichi TaxID=94029 RepID=A0A8T0FL70_ARGBR|nr:hypothetical protein HNY73_003371 [Argiope bruennichi]
MNNHPEYSSPEFPTYGHQHQDSSDGPQRLPYHNTPELSRNEGLISYPISFRKKAPFSCNYSSTHESRQTFSNKESNTCKYDSQQYRHSRDGILSSGRCSQIDPRMRRQSAPRTNFLNESLEHSYSNMEKLDPKTSSLSDLKQNQETSEFQTELHSISKNFFSRENALYGDLLLSGSTRNRKFGRDFTYQNEQTFSSKSHLNETLSSPIYSKSASFTNNKTFSNEPSPDTDFPHNNLSIDMPHSGNHNFKPHAIQKQVKEIHTVLKEPKRPKESNKRVSLSSPSESSVPASVEDKSLDNLQSASKSFYSQILPKKISWDKNTTDIREQSQISNNSEMSYSESSQTSENIFSGKFSMYSQSSANKSHEIHESDVLNLRESKPLKNSLESQNTCVIQNSSHKMNDKKMNYPTIVGIMPRSTITSPNNAKSLKEDEKVNNFDNNFSTEQNICENSQDSLNENTFPSNRLSETSNTKTDKSLLGKSFNNSSLCKHLELSASCLTISHEKLPSNQWITSKSPERVLNKSFESRNYSPNFDRSVPTNESQDSDNLRLKNSLSENRKSTNKRPPSPPDGKVSSDECQKSLPVNLKDSFNKCFEIIKDYPSVVFKNQELKGKTLSAKNNSNKSHETTQKISPNPIKNISTNESSKSASIPFLNEDNDIQSLSSIINVVRDDLSQETKSSGAPLLNSVRSVSRGFSKNESALEYALEEISSPVVGLDYIVEDRRSLPIEGRFPFKCTLCNSSIAKTSILDHIQGSKHRLRYLKIKDGAAFDRIMRTEEQHNDIETLLCEASAKLEQKYGRGRVIVSLESACKGAKKEPSVNIHRISSNYVDVDFESTSESDAKDLEANSAVESEPEKLANSTLFESKDVEDASSKNSITSCFGSLPKQNFDHGNKGLKILSHSISERATNMEEITEVCKIDKSSVVQCEGSLNAQKEDSSIDKSYSSGNISFKRSFPPYDNETYKNTKRQHLENPNMEKFWSTDFMVQSNPEPLSNKGSATSQITASYIFNPLILDQMSKWDISSENEADILMIIVGEFLKLLLQYKYKDHSNAVIENLMNCVCNKSTEEIFKIFSNLNMSAANTIKGEVSAIVSKNDNASKSTLVLEDNAVTGHQMESQNLSQNNSTVFRFSEKPPFYGWPTSNNGSATHGQTSVTISQTAQNNTTWSSSYPYHQKHGFTVSPVYQPYGFPPVPPVPPVSVPMVAQSSPVMPPGFIPPLPPPQQGAVPLPPFSGVTSVPLPPLPPPLLPSELPPLPRENFSIFL